MPDQPDLPADEPARRRIAHALDETLFVEAGAGSGKTSSLVNRIIDLIVVERVPLRHIAAITFTEKAAAELRDRIRTALERTIADGSTTEDITDLCRVGLNDIDAAAISTLHAFAQRILSEHPIEAGLPPAIEVMDEISSQVAFDERWREFFGRLLDTKVMEETLLLGFACNVGESHLRQVAKALGDNWDLAETQIPEWPDPGGVRVDAFMVAVGEAVALTEHGDSHDKLVARLHEIAAYAEELEGTTNGPDRMRLLESTKPSFKAGNIGAEKHWDGAHSRDAVRTVIGELGQLRETIRDHTVDAVIKRLTVALRDFTVAAAHERRANGRLEFHDLLVFARQLLRDDRHGVEVRVALQKRYQYLLLDEFQDTDPIQIDLAVLLTSTDPDAASKPWNQTKVPSGRLFFVGDPKQSIYRFRRADIALFLEAREAFSAAPTLLTTNFRSTASVIDWVNSVFGQLIEYSPDSQPEYQPLTAHRGNPRVGPAMMVIGETAHADKLTADELRDFEAADVAATVNTILTDRWQVEEEAGEDESGDDWRDARLGNITVLLPARTSLPALERALDDAGLPYRAETSSLVWSTREIRDLMAALRAIDDPTDELSLVTALRSAVYGCGDDDLYRFKVEHNGTWSYQRASPSTLATDHPVVAAMTHLDDLHKSRLWLSPSELIERLVRDRRLFELGVARGRPRDVWRRIRFVIDQARAYGDSEGGNLRQFLHWARMQSAEGARVAETVLPETDDDSIRIMTVHASKGLEFPITIMSGLTTKPGGRHRGVRVHFPRNDDAIVAMSSALTTLEYEEYKPIDEQMDHHERVRLLYVAATRARDHLVVSLHREARSDVDDRPDAGLTSAELIHRGSEKAGVSPASFVISPASTQPRRPGTRQKPTTPLLSRIEWEEQRDAVLTKGARARTLAATTIAKRAAEAHRDPGLDKDARDLELPPWNKGRYGTAIGRAVHAVLQTVDLSTGDGLLETAAAQAAAEGVIGRGQIVVDLVQSALDCSIVAEASTLQYWRETYVAAPIGDVTIEGYVDLLYRRPDGLVVVDYKTDAVASDGDLDEKLDRYALQGATYALAIEIAVGDSVADVVFLFLARDGAHIRSVPNLADRIADVRQFVTTTPQHPLLSP